MQLHTHASRFARLFLPAVLAGVLLHAPACADSPGASNLDARLRPALVGLLAQQPGHVGVAVIHVESRAQTGVNQGDLFPLASVVKLPVAIAVLADVDERTLKLDSLVRLEPRHLRLGTSPLSERYPNGGRLTVEELVTAMLVDSDNAACDRLFELLGGPAEVQRRLAKLSVPRMRVDRTEGELSLVWNGVTAPLPSAEWTRTRLDSMARSVPRERRAEAQVAFARDHRDSGSPYGAAWLLAQIERGSVLSKPGTDWLLGTMARCKTGPGRIPARLPAGTPVARKTGTWGAAEAPVHVVNDLGLVTLPGDGGHLSIAVFIEDWTGTVPAAEALIARVARTAYDVCAP